MTKTHILTKKQKYQIYCINQPFFFCIFFGGLECVGHSFAYVAQHFVFLRDVWIRTQIAAVARRCVTNLATHLHTSYSCKKENVSSEAFLRYKKVSIVFSSFNR